VPPPNVVPATRPDNLADVRPLLDQFRRDGVSYRASPEDWRDRVIYFLLPDRFSDGKEDSRPLLTRQEIRDLRTAGGRPGWSWKDWAESGKRWQGGTINGVRSKLGYLQDLGVSCVWLGPLLRQRARLDTYHGYGIQDFLDVDPRFGTRQDLLELVAAAHQRDMCVLLDIVINHSGDNWGYLAPQSRAADAVNEPAYRPWPNFYGAQDNDGSPPWTLAWRDEDQSGFTTVSADISAAAQGVWPKEFQDPALYTRAGMGNLGEGDIADAHAEHKRTDFFSLKDFALDNPRALSFLIECHKYWIALTDCDGFRIDTVKHISLEDARNFCGAIREFAESLGKKNFLLIGEIAGGDDFQDFVLDNLGVLQRNMSAALDIGSARMNLHNAAKGLIPGGTYLRGFDAASSGFESHRSFGNRHVSILDDHDHVIGDKLRFSAQIPDESPVKDHHVAAATALQLLTLGIPCVYYGSEQALAGPAESQLQYVRAEGWNDGGNHGDRYLREALFGPEHPRAHHEHHDLEAQTTTEDSSLPGFGAFGTAGKHCFDPTSPAYVRIASLCRTRAEHIVLRTGRQYPRQSRMLGTDFEYPLAGELVAWSRILDNQEALCVINPNGLESRGADIVVSAELWSPGTEFTVVANTAESAEGATYSGTHTIGSKLLVKGRRMPGEPAFLQVRDVQPAEVLVLIKLY